MEIATGTSLMMTALSSGFSGIDFSDIFAPVVQSMLSSIWSIVPAILPVLGPLMIIKIAVTLFNMPFREDAEYEELDNDEYHGDW